MILYHSTRSKTPTYLFSEVIKKGLAEDGGLFVPTTLPNISLPQLEKLQHLPYAQQALFVLSLFQTDFSHETLQTITQKAYSNTFDTPDITPLKKLFDTTYLLELWHGPTWAFKDMALQLLPYLLEEAIQKEKTHYCILTATSGDTGKAALEGFKNKEHISLLTFFPDKKISSIQEVSMITQEGKNLGVYPVVGNFDDVQRVIKDIFQDTAFAQKLLENYNVKLTAANSINWGRLLAQIIYHIHSYVTLLEQKSISLGDPIDIAVPSGNFGSILGAFLAKKMGLPIRKLICASNKNNILTDFLQTGIFDIRNRTLEATTSPAMDILVPSNVERLLYVIMQNTKQVGEWMQELQEKKYFIVDEKTKQTLQETFFADWVSNEQTLQVIKQVYEETKTVIDPHTAVAVAVIKRYQQEEQQHIPLVICSTAHWAKFPETVYQALIDDKNNLDEFTMIEIIQKETGSSVPSELLELKNKKILYTQKISAEKEVIEQVSIDFFEKQRERL